nr:energy-coupling factor transporter ATPase [Clostridia bacterium]
MENTKQPFIKVENLNFSYENEYGEKIPAVKNISFEIERGAFVAVLGHNGSGKSTLAKLMNMILTPDSGKIYIDGRDITDEALLEDEDAVADVRRDIGMVFQNPDNQLVATIVEEDVAFGPENMGVEPSEIRKRVDEALAVVGMTEFARHSPHQLSGGQKQRIAIAGIIAMLPSCIIFDESTAMLDPSGRDEVMKTIQMLNKEKGITVLHITHNMNEAVIADRVMVVSDGGIVLDGTPREVFSEVQLLQSVGLDVPQTTELIWELSGEGIDIEGFALDEDEGADVLMKLFEKGKDK